METTSKSPFQIAERYIQLRKRCASPSWGDTVLQWNELIVGPILCIFSIFIGTSDLFGSVSSAIACYTAWSQWIEYNTVRLDVQQMFLTTMITGGPHIVTNDPTYMPYVYADAVIRASHRLPLERDQVASSRRKRLQVRFLH